MLLPLLVVGVLHVQVCQLAAAAEAASEHPLARAVLDFAAAELSKAGTAAAPAGPAMVSKPASGSKGSMFVAAYSLDDDRSSSDGAVTHGPLSSSGSPVSTPARLSMMLSTGVVKVSEVQVRGPEAHNMSSCCPGPGISTAAIVIKQPLNLGFSNCILNALQLGQSQFALRCMFIADPLFVADPMHCRTILARGSQPTGQMSAA